MSERTVIAVGIGLIALVMVALVGSLASAKRLNHERYLENLRACEKSASCRLNPRQAGYLERYKND